MSTDEELIAALAAIIIDQMPEAAEIGDGSPTLSEGGARFHVDWKASEAPVGRRRSRVVIVFSDELLEALVQRRQEDDRDHAQALDLVNQEIAARFRGHEAGIRHDEWLITEELLSDGE